MKKLVCLVLVLALTTIGVSAFAADLVIYSARNERLNNIVIPGFEAATGLKVEMITGSTGEVNHADGQQGPVPGLCIDRK